LASSSSSEASLGIVALVLTVPAFAQDKALDRYLADAIEERPALEQYLGK
jgi:hypothetical protein